MIYAKLAAWKRTKHLSPSLLWNGNRRQRRRWWRQGAGAARGRGRPGGPGWNRALCVRGAGAPTAPLAPAPAGAASLPSGAELAPCLESSRPTETYGQQMWRARGDPPRKYLSVEIVSRNKQLQAIFPSATRTLERGIKKKSFCGNLDAFPPPQQLVSCDSTVLRVKIMGIFHH